MRLLHIERFRLNGAWVLVGTWRDDAKVRVERFEALELELGRRVGEVIVDFPS